MSKSYCNLLYHIVFSTGNREPWLGPEGSPRIHQYIGAIVKKEGGIPLAISGTADHIHILTKLRQDKSMSDAVRSMKANSSRWIRQTFPNAVAFKWQTGYGAFSVSQSQVADIKEYIMNQEEHHRSVTFEEEFRALLEKHGMKYEEGWRKD